MANSPAPSGGSGGFGGPGPAGGSGGFGGPKSSPDRSDRGQDAIGGVAAGYTAGNPYPGYRGPTGTRNPAAAPQRSYDGSGIDAPRPPGITGPRLVPKVKPTWRGILNLISDVFPIGPISLAKPMIRAAVTEDISPYGDVIGWSKTEERDMVGNAPGAIGNTGGKDLNAINRAFGQVSTTGGNLGRYNLPVPRLRLTMGAKAPSY